MLLKYYEKTKVFNEELPLYSITWLKYGILLHGGVSLFMFTNNHLFPTDNPESALQSISIEGLGLYIKERWF